MAFDFGALFSAVSEIGSAGFEFGSNVYAINHQQTPVYGNNGGVQYVPVPTAQQPQTPTALSPSVIALMVVVVLMLLIVGFFMVKQTEKAK